MKFATFKIHVARQLPDRVARSAGGVEPDPHRVTLYSSRASASLIYFLQKLRKSQPAAAEPQCKFFIRRGRPRDVAKIETARRPRRPSPQSVVLRLFSQSSVDCFQPHTGDGCFRFSLAGGRTGQSCNSVFLLRNEAVLSCKNNDDAASAHFVSQSFRRELRIARVPSPL